MIRLLLSVTAAMHCKKRLAVFLSPAGMSPTKLPRVPPPLLILPVQTAEERGVEVEPNYKTTKKPVIFFSYSCFLPLPVIHNHYSEIQPVLLECFSLRPCATATNGIEKIRIKKISNIIFSYTWYKKVL